MNQELLQHLLKKKSKAYPLIWLCIYAYSERNEYRGSVASLLSLVKVSKSTLVRALAEGQEFDPSIQIMMKGDDLRVIAPKKTSAAKNKKPILDKADPVFKDMMDVYCEFFNAQTGVQPKISVADGAALKKIIKYLKTQVKDKTDESAVVEAWKYVFTNWGKLSSFQQARVKLVQIDSDLSNILFSLKNPPKTKTTNESRLDKFKRAAERDVDDQ